MFWTKKTADNSHDSKVILGMVMLKDKHSFHVDRLVTDFKASSGRNIKKLTGDSGALVFTVDSERVAIAHMDVPVPARDIEGTAQYAYNWQTALEDTKDYKSHLIILLLHGGQDPVKRFKIFTQIICSLLRTTNAVGVYKGNQSLLIPKDDYLNEAETMSGKHLPLNLWIYIGLRETDNGNSGYTYGLKEFGKDELEIVNSFQSLESIRAFLLNIAHYVLAHDVTFQEGQTVGGSEDEKIAIRHSKGQFVSGDTFKLAY